MNFTLYGTFKIDYLTFDWFSVVRGAQTGQSSCDTGLNWALNERLYFLMLSWAKQLGSLNGAPEFPSLYSTRCVLFLPRGRCAVFSPDLAANETPANSQRAKERKSMFKEEDEKTKQKTKNKKRNTSPGGTVTHKKKDTPSPLKWPFYCWGRIHSCQALEPVCRHGTAVGAAYCPPCQAEQEVHCALLINSHSHRGVIGTACQYSVYSAKT